LRASDETAMKRILGAIAMLGVLAAHAQESYQPQAPVEGTIRFWGHSEMAGVVRRWADGFARFHPKVKVETKLMGSDTAIPGLYAGNADIALMGRENDVTDDNGFSRPKQYKFTRLEVMNGSLATPDKSDALVVFVNRDNPLERLTLAELDAIVGCERRRGHAPIRTWGDLGLGGEWAGKAIHAHLYDADTRTGHFFRRTVLGGSFKMEWERVSEYRDAAPILKALRSDRYGIAVASLKYATPEVKAVALARE